MSKIRGALLLLALQSMLYAVGQTVGAVQRNAVWTDQQPVFTAHRLTDRVELEKKRAYAPSIRGQKVSLPCPTTPQTQRQ